MGQEPFNRMVFDAARDQAAETLGEDPTPAKLLQVIDDAIELAGNLTEEMASRDIAGLDDIACRSGCAWCCYQQVGITAPQALHIAERLRSGELIMSADEALESLTALDQRIHGVNKFGRLAAAVPCAFLGDDDACTIYDVRPFACRGANSIDADFCRRILEETDTVRNELDSAEGGAWIHALPYQSMAALQDGVLTATTEAGLPEEKLELTAALRIALGDEDAGAKWCRGEDIFLPSRLPTT